MGSPKSSSESYKHQIDLVIELEKSHVLILIQYDIVTFKVSSSEIPVAVARQFMVQLPASNQDDYQLIQRFREPDYSGW